MKESIVRSTEFIMALVSSYLASITLVQTTLYNRGLNWIQERIAEELLPFLNNLDFFIMALAIALCVFLWRKGTEASFAKIFAVNMFLYFPAVLDFSNFNWVGLIFGLIPNTKLSPLWVFAVGLLLQVTYIWLRYTIRFRFARKELTTRGTSEEALDKITGGQMWYLTVMASGTILISLLLYLSIPYIQREIMKRIHEIPYPHMAIGIISAILLSVTIVFYLHGASLQPTRTARAQKAIGARSGALKID